MDRVVNPVDDAEVAATKAIATIMNMTKNRETAIPALLIRFLRY